MIYVFVGNDFKTIKSKIRELVSNSLIENIFNPNQSLLQEIALSVDMFGEKKFYSLDNCLKNKTIKLSEEGLKPLADSVNTFFLIEDVLTVADEKKIKKYSKIEKFVKKENKIDSSGVVFDIAEAFSKREKIKTWILYLNAIYSGVEPEVISGTLFWKIKTMVLYKNKNFTNEELKKQSKNIVSLYHKAHGGEVDFVIGLEQFILDSLK